MPIVLVVDDSPTDRALIGGLLARESEDWIVEYAEDGNDALEKLDITLPHVVITDMQMPGLDGMQLVGAVQERFANIPVVLVTGRGSEELAAQALAGGAASYVSKSDLSKRLSETLKQVLQMADSGQGWRRLMHTLTEASFSLELENDPSLIPLVVNVVQQMASEVKLCHPAEQRHLGIALDEALLNAMYHGNLALPQAKVGEVREALREGNTSELVEERRSEPPYDQRRVKVDIVLSPLSIRITLRDDGDGFNLDNVPASGAVDAVEKAGRGLVLMKAFMDEVEFADEGSQVTMVKYKD